MTNETSKPRKSVTAIIRDTGLLVAVLGLAVFVFGAMNQSNDWFQIGIATGFAGIAVAVVGGILWVAGLRR